MAVVKQYFHILNALKTGDMSKEALEAATKDTGVEFYRLSTYLWECRKAGAIIEVVKNGREVVSYRLKNPENFPEGWEAKFTRQPKPKAEKPAKVAEVVSVETTPAAPVVADVKQALTADEKKAKKAAADKARRAAAKAAKAKAPEVMAG